MPGSLVLIDSNVLIRWVQPQDLQFRVAQQAIRRLEAFGELPCYASQNLGEFWNVLTRAAVRNGYGLSPEQANTRANEIEAKFQLIPDSPLVYQEWRRLLVDYRVSGVQVHDALLVAAMRVYGVLRILTFNTRDFARFTGIEALHPAQLATP